jgi:hypothetical protein
MHPTPLQVVLHALTLPGEDPRDGLAAGQGYADAQHRAVADRIVVAPIPASKPTIRHRAAATAACCTRSPTRLCPRTA